MFEEFPVARKPPPDPALLEFLSARKALKISPDCADAYLRLSQEAAKTPAEAPASAAGNKHYRKLWGAGRWVCCQISK